MLKDAIALVPLAALLLGTISTVGGFYLYMSGSVRKRYAAERDFQHLKANQEQIKQLLVSMDDDIGDLKVEIVRMAEKL